MIPAVIERCAGIDIGKKFLAVCVMTGPANQEGKTEVRKFGTVRHELEALRKWLRILKQAMQHGPLQRRIE